MRIIDIHTDDDDEVLLDIVLEGTPHEEFWLHVLDRDDDVALASLTRAELHRLHEAIGQALGLTHARPTTPKTASRASASAHGSRAFDRPISPELASARLGDPEE